MGASESNLWNGLDNCDVCKSSRRQDNIGETFNETLRSRGMAWDVKHKPGPVSSNGNPQYSRSNAGNKSSGQASDMSRRGVQFEGSRVQREEAWNGEEAKDRTQKMGAIQNSVYISTCATGQEICHTHDGEQITLEQRKRELYEKGLASNRKAMQHFKARHKAIKSSDLYEAKKELHQLCAVQCLNCGHPSHVNHFSCDYCDTPLCTRNADVIVDPKDKVEEKPRIALPLDVNGEHIETVVKKERTKINVPTQVARTQSEALSSNGSFKVSPKLSQNGTFSESFKSTSSKPLPGLPGVGLASNRAGLGAAPSPRSPLPNRMGNSSRSLLRTQTSP